MSSMISASFLAVYMLLTNQAVLVVDVESLEILLVSAVECISATRRHGTIHSRLVDLLEDVLETTVVLLQDGALSESETLENQLAEDLLLG
jgi:hypothetical protein